jgi:hypothetical protein
VFFDLVTLYRVARGFDNPLAKIFSEVFGADFGQTQVVRVTLATSRVAAVSALAFVAVGAGQEFADLCGNLAGLHFPHPLGVSLVPYKTYITRSKVKRSPQTGKGKVKFSEFS